MRRRQPRFFDCDAFVEDLKQSRLVVDSPSDVTEPLDCYDATLIELLDKRTHAVGVYDNHGSPCRSHGSMPDVDLRN